MPGMLVTARLDSRARVGLVFLLTTISCGSSLTNSDATAPDDAIDATADADTPNVGATCDILTDAGPSQGVYNAEALECTSRVCVKPIVQPGATDSFGTTAFCTTPCNQDSDCDGQTRDPTNPRDSRCATSFACGILFVKGRICCQKLCICRDFLGPSGPATPVACQGDAAASCFQ